MDFATFFDGYTYGQLVLGLVTIIIFLIPKAGVTFLNFLKNKMKLQGKYAQYFILGILIIITFLAMYVTGVFVDIKWTLGTVVTQFMAALVPAKLAYKALKLKLPANIPE